MGFLWVSSNSMTHFMGSIFSIKFPKSALAEHVKLEILVGSKVSANFAKHKLSLSAQFLFVLVNRQLPIFVKGFVKTSRSFSRRDHGFTGERVHYSP